MPLNIDILAQSTTEIDGQWYTARPLLGPTISRWKDAWLVLVGKADAIVYGPHKPISDAPIGNILSRSISDYGAGNEFNTIINDRVDEALLEQKVLRIVSSIF